MEEQFNLTFDGTVVSTGNEEECRWHFIEKMGEDIYPIPLLAPDGEQYSEGYDDSRAEAEFRANPENASKYFLGYEDGDLLWIDPTTEEIFADSGCTEEYLFERCQDSAWEDREVWSYELISLEPEAKLKVA